MKQLMYVFVGILGSIGLVLLSLPLLVYGCLLRVIFHPVEVSNEIMDLCGKFQCWIDKKLEGKK